MSSPDADVLVLCYHAVSPTWPIGMAIRPASLEEQVRHVLAQGYEPATFVDAATAPPARKTFSVTFDDAFLSVFEHGLPILERLGVPATVFVSTDFADTPEKPLIGPVLQPFLGTEHERDLLPMGWSQLHVLAEKGWEVASHTVSHPFLTTVDDAELERQLTESRSRLIAEFGTCRTIAYPSGDHDDRVVAFTGRAGYDVAGTLPKRFPDPIPPLRYPRVSVQRDDSLSTFRVKVSPLTRRLRRTAAWDALDTARRVALAVRRR